MTGVVLVAVAGALAVAAGAALQERTVLSAPAVGINQLRLLRHLCRSPHWLAGTLLTASGVAAHIWALTQAPLVVIQPISISGLPFAVLLSAFFTRRRLTLAQVAGSFAVTVALAGLVSSLPQDTETPVLSPGETVALSVGCAAVMLGCLGVARWGGGTVRAGALALAGGAAYGVSSALARLVGVAVLENPVALVHPLTAIAVAVGLCGAVLVQNAYRSGRFALAYAILLLSDPLAATVVGVAFLGERLPTDPWNAAVAGGATLLGATGVVTLARSPGRSGNAARVPADGTRQPEHALASR
ncbi:hypothetical protein FHX37_0022 [Haloactinospora alba]|uniref:Magnesium transporter NIPA n=1 Tax=Haloactinospora alba TaxID=405555 RepID=A0A543NE96_9ACTN|nr:DMT family transporter [Haloactinospora alba]TQN30161.1 hypothetical protein FHX37_0022 [Haloactinospora alba]